VLLIEKVQKVVACTSNGQLLLFKLLKFKAMLTNSADNIGFFKRIPIGVSLVSLLKKSWNNNTIKKLRYSGNTAYKYNINDF
jgi:hypothetical protein